MPTLKEQVEAVVADLVLNEARLDIWVNGTDSQDYTPSGGGSVPSIRKFIAETFKFQGTYAAGGTNYTIGQTFRGTSGDDQYRMFRVTANFTSTTFGADSGSYETLFDFAQVVTDAETAQAAAEAAQAAAEAAQAAAETIYDNFDDRYLGFKSSDPAVDNDGNPLADGAIYWNTTTNTLRFYDLGNTVWVDPSTDAAASAAAALVSETNAAASEAGAASAASSVVAGKDFAGGVHLDGVAGFGQIGMSSVYADNDIFTFGFYLGVDVLQSGGHIFTFGTDNLNNVQVVPNGNIFRAELIIGGVTIGAQVAYTTGGKGVYVVTLDKSAGSVTVYDPSGGTTTDNISAVLVSSRADGDIYFGKRPVLNDRFGNFGMRDLFLANRILSSSEVADLQNNGLTAWLAANPENKWAGVTPYYTSDFSVDTDGWTATRAVATGNIDAIGGVDDVLRAVVGSTNATHLISKSIATEAGKSVRVSFKIFIPSSNSVVDGVRVTDDNGTVGGFYNLTPDTWLEFSSEYTPPASLKVLDFIAASSSSTLLEDLGGDDTFYIKDVVVTRIGALAALPMDEGIGFQLHDLSDNHYDALLSATGFEHLNPKRKGSIRDFNVDAYNGGSGAVELLSSSRNILPANVALTDGVIRNNAAGALTANALDISRSDRTLTSQVGDNGDAIAQDELDPVIYSGAQNPTYRNVQIDGSTDADATDVDIRIDFESID